MAVKKRINEGGAEAVACAHGGHHLRLYRIAAEHTGGFASSTAAPSAPQVSRIRRRLLKRRAREESAASACDGVSVIQGISSVRRTSGSSSRLLILQCRHFQGRTELHRGRNTGGAKIKVAEFKTGHAGKQTAQGSGVAPFPQSKGAEIENIAAGIVNALSGYAVVGGIGNEIVFRHGIAVKGYIAAPGFLTGQYGNKAGIHGKPFEFRKEPAVRAYHRPRRI